MVNYSPKPRKPVFRAEDLRKIIMWKTPILQSELIKIASKELKCSRGTVYNLLNRLKEQDAITVKPVEDKVIIIKNGHNHFINPRSEVPSSKGGGT